MGVEDKFNKVQFENTYNSKVRLENLKKLSNELRPLKFKGRLVLHRYLQEKYHIKFLERVKIINKLYNIYFKEEGSENIFWNFKSGERELLLKGVNVDEN